MDILEATIKNLDALQQKHPILSFPYAVIKRVGEDDAGFQAALITYYGFLSLFPLLLVATSIVGILSLGNANVEASVMRSISNYFPVVGDQLARNIHASSRSGIALAVGLVVTFYGARGGADAFRNAVNHVWHVPKAKRAQFPQSLLQSLSMTLIGGLGLALAAVFSALASGLGRLFIYKILAALASLCILIPTLYYLYTVGLPSGVATKQDRLRNAVASGVGITIIQAAGGYLVTSQLKTLSPLYGTFAIVLGLLFWIYLQALVVLYTVEITIIFKKRLWPRSLSGKLPTAADKSAKLD